MPQTLDELEQNAREELEEFLHDNPDASDNDISEQISEIAHQQVPIHNYDRLAIAMSSASIANTAPENPPASLDALSVLGAVLYEHLQEYLNKQYSEWTERRDEAKDEIDTEVLLMTLPDGYSTAWEGPALGVISVQAFRDADYTMIFEKKAVYNRDSDINDTEYQEAPELSEVLENLLDTVRADVRKRQDSAIGEELRPGVWPEGYTLTKEDENDVDPTIFDLVVTDPEGIEVGREHVESLEEVEGQLPILRVLAINDSHIREEGDAITGEAGEEATDADLMEADGRQAREEIEAEYEQEG